MVDMIFNDIFISIISIHYHLFFRVLKGLKQDKGFFRAIFLELFWEYWLGFFLM